MVNKRLDEQPKRSRGRPSGSAPYRDADLQILRGFADRSLDGGRKLAAYIREHHANAEEKDVRRLQARWRTEHTGLLAEARKRREAEEARTLWDDISDFFVLLERGSSAAAGLMAKLSLSLERARARALANGEPDDLKLVDAAGALPAFEEQMALGVDGFAQRAGKTLSNEMSPSLRLYGLALTLYTLSLQMGEAEADRETDENSDQGGGA
ncbi:hypothetical protein [Shinella sp.]|uniref:hypothetical protein n=1 Tax=Shinella sp. TaxID=1870904 RepID=UPI003F6FCCBE